MPGTTQGAHAATADIALAVVCPMANEEAQAVAFVEAVLDVCARYRFRSVRFFAVLDRVSTDATRHLLTDLGRSRPEVEVVWAPENRSVVDAYLRGYREALDSGADWVLEIDAGFSHDPDDIPAFFDRMAEGHDCVFGTRFALGGAIADSALQRKVISRGGSALSNLLLGTGSTDATSGFELFRADVLRGVLDRGVHSRGPFFQTEIKAYCRNLDVVEAPIRYRGASHAVGRVALADSFRNLGRLVALRVRGEL